MGANVTLYVAALRLYCSLLERDPPEGYPEDTWDRLIADSWHLYLLAALHRRGGEHATRCLGEMTLATRECLDLLVRTSVAAPLVRRAWMCLRVMLDELEAEAAAGPRPEARP